MIFIMDGRITFTLLFVVAIVAPQDLQQEVDSEETSLVKTFASRSDYGHKAQVVTGTFRFRRVVNDESSANAAGKTSGWDIEGCYCATGTRCSCSGNRNRVKMFVRTGSRGGESPGSGRGVPLPPIGDNELQETERERERLRIPASQTEGCFCNGSGCSGSTCGSLNGCVCNSSGTCWGAACSARVPVPAPVAGQLLPSITQGQITTSPQAGISSSSGIQQVLSTLNPVNLVRNALMAQPALVNGQQVMQLTPISGSMITQTSQNSNDCTCNQSGCSGNGCASLNGCFCVGQNCWGNACQTSVFSQQVRQPMQQAGNILDIPELFGGGGGGGAGMDVEGQVIPVVQGMPVQRLNGQRARRIRNGMKGRRGMGGMAASRVRTRTQRPEQPVLKKRSRVPSRSGKDDDWAPEPVFKRVTINGVPTFVRFSRRRDSDDGEETTQFINATRNPEKKESDVLTSARESIEKQRSRNENESDVEIQTLSEEESERRESVSEEPLLFSEDVVDVKIVSLDDR